MFKLVPFKWLLLNEYICQSSYRLPIPFLSNFPVQILGYIPRKKHIFMPSPGLITLESLQMGFGLLHFQSTHAYWFWCRRSPNHTLRKWLWHQYARMYKQPVVCFLLTEGFKVALFLQFPLFPITELWGSCRNIHMYTFSITF